MHSLICFAGDFFEEQTSGDVDESFLTPELRSLNVQQHVWKALRAWQVRNLVSGKAMQDFIRIAPEVGLSGLPKDWRTIVRRDVLFAARTKVAEVVEVCSACFLHRFPPEHVLKAKRCTNCGYSRLFCPRCEYRCILASSIGNKSKKYIAHCNLCGANSDVKVTVRSYIFDIVDHLKFVFSTKSRALSLLAPFRREGEELYVSKSSVTGLGESDNNSSTFIAQDNWIDIWRKWCQESKYFKELWHGERFYMHSLFEEHGMRSVLLEVSLDWFPPHKDKKAYSVGVLSCCIANMSLHERSKMENAFVLAIIEGPSEPKHTLALLQPVFKRIALLDQYGVRLFDSLTNSELTVHVSVGLCVCDSPANAKLGAFIGLSGYLPCFRCCYKASLCGCKFNSPDGSRTRTTWDNEGMTAPTSLTRPKVLVPGIRDDHKKKKGEHMAFVDTNVIKKFQLKDDVEVRQDMVRIGLVLWDPGHVKRHYEDLKSNLRVTGVSPLLIISSSRFSFVTDFGIDGLHTLLKGIALRLIEVTFDERYVGSTFNINTFEKGRNMKEFAARMRRFQWPTRLNPPQRLHKSTGGLKAAEIWLFFRVQCLIALQDLIPTQAYILWTLMTRLLSGLLHTHVSKSWIENDHSNSMSRMLHTFYERFLDYYGKCHMPVNFHLMLHCQHDCKDWSSLRSHSTFKFERLYHELMVTPRSNGSNKITQSMVRAVTELRSRQSAKIFVDPALNYIPWPCDLPPVDTIECLEHLINENLKYLKAVVDEFGRPWKIGEMMTVLDHSNGDFVYVGDSIAFVIKCFLRFRNQTYGLLYPVNRLTSATRLPLGTFQIHNTLTDQNSKPVLVNLSSIADHIHITHVVRYNHPAIGALYVPLCGPLPYKKD